MAMEKLRQKVINLLICFVLIFRKITNAPSVVERPAIVEMSKGIKICIASPIKYMLFDYYLKRKLFICFLLNISH